MCNTANSAVYILVITINNKHKHIKGDDEIIGEIYLDIDFLFTLRPE